jgi:hypothetical protein
MLLQYLSDIPRTSGKFSGLEKEKNEKKKMKKKKGE